MSATAKTSLLALLGTALATLGLLELAACGICLWALDMAVPELAFAPGLILLCLSVRFLLPPVAIDRNGRRVR